jgi:hypothetical protein
MLQIDFVSANRRPLGGSVAGGDVDGMTGA